MWAEDRQRMREEMLTTRALEQREKTNRKDSKNLSFERQL